MSDYSESSQWETLAHGNTVTTPLRWAWVNLPVPHLPEWQLDKISYFKSTLTRASESEPPGRGSLRGGEFGCRLPQCQYQRHRLAEPSLRLGVRATRKAAAGARLRVGLEGIQV